MISNFDLEIGERLWMTLLAEGGFCWDHRSEGRSTISIHVNRGKKLSESLLVELSRSRDKLKAFIFNLHDRQAEEDARIERMMEDPRC